METIDASAMSRLRTDARRKIGSPIFYFNTPEAWGGQTLVPDAESKWPRHSAPDYADLREAQASRALGNRCFSLRPGQSLLACRQGSAVSPQSPCARSLSWRPTASHRR